MQELQNFGRNEWFRNDGKILPVYGIFLKIVVLTICKVPIMFHYFPSLVDYKLSVPSKFPGC